MKKHIKNNKYIVERTAPPVLRPCLSLMRPSVCHVVGRWLYTWLASVRRINTPVRARHLLANSRVGVASWDSNPRARHHLVSWQRKNYAARGRARLAHHRVNHCVRNGAVSLPQKVMGGGLCHFRRIKERWRTKVVACVTDQADMVEMWGVFTRFQVLVCFEPDRHNISSSRLWLCKTN